MAELEEKLAEIKSRPVNAPASDPNIEAIIQRLEKGDVEVQRLRIKENQVFALTAGELLAVCNKYPTHPHADIYRGAVAGLPKDHEVNIDRVDLEALLSGKAVKIEEEQHAEFIDGVQKIVTTERKILDG